MSVPLIRLALGLETLDWDLDFPRGLNYLIVSNFEVRSKVEIMELSAPSCKSIFPEGQKRNSQPFLFAGWSGPCKCTLFI